MPGYAGDLTPVDVELPPILLGRAAGRNTSNLTTLSEVSDHRIAVLREQADALGQIKDTQSDREDSEGQLRSAVGDGRQASIALKGVAPENERSTRDHASEGDRGLRDQVVALERQLAEARNKLEQRSKEISELKMDLAICRADQALVEEDMKSLEHQKKEQESALKLQVQNLKREVEEGRDAMVELRRRMVAQERVTTEIINVATRIRDANIETMTNCQNFILGPRSAGANAVIAGDTSTGTDDSSAASPITNTTSTSQPSSSSAFPPSTSPTTQAALPAQSAAANVVGESPTRPIPPQEALAGLTAFDLEAFIETVNKTGHTIRKWQKQCKEYRDRAKGKIAFRNFREGDLALFLPTRNAEARPWAAFNGL
ncbi:oligomeric, coiled-coil, peripheral membrane protein [Tulasnella sp. 417]|nr:oligomeric, coiled-coil, peripheral membrane protein [Tulasnella sp. 417]